MNKGGEPSHNLLAQAGLITNESGRVFSPPCGNLDLPWLFHVSKETNRRAREHFQQKAPLDDDVRFGWFIASTEAEFTGLKLLLERDWRRALQAWKGVGLYQVHNRATLHRALYYSENSERPDAHIRECLRLYHHLSELAPRQRIYRHFQEELIEDLKRSILSNHTAGDDESAARSLKVLAGTVGMLGVEHLQEKMFRSDLNGLKVSCARVQKELLAYQGVAHAPPMELLQACEQDLTDVVLPLAARFSFILVDGSKLGNELEALVATACGVLAQSFSKAGEQRSAKRWLGEALRWEPSAVEQWRGLPVDDFGDEESANISFPEKEAECQVKPSSKGSKLLGIQSRAVLRSLGEAREEWVESLFVGFVPLLPLRRFAAYKNLDTDEVGYFLRIPLTLWDHVRQGLLVLMIAFAASLGYLALVSDEKPVELVDSAVVENRAEKVENLVDALKVLAQRESKLLDLDKRSTEQENELLSIRGQRTMLIEELENLERDK